ncbi:cytidine deaminase [Histoplasma capsulatum G186AR]|uniref:Cytidine deaminase n=1 Tax=Ajellomyces capsulatus (strain G186AR / H82 / ATCC MYA-2454 / RMSCC 2432) TaxID=447093 RepID=C0NKP6_AJECG|nr:cytidine deaminase [Histoplasma capsulatum G186AR]EEH08437.1 cytidine deaminase [Histoplasma capsulatum G186AR]
MSTSSQVSAAELQTLSSKAIAAKEAAHCPYSKFRVGACLLTEEREFIVGANVENVSYPVGVCAERCAFSTAVVGIRDYTMLSPSSSLYVVFYYLAFIPIWDLIVAGHKNFKAIAVATDIVPGASPCGMCRQFMREFCPPSFPVYMYGGDGQYTVKTMGELLPNSFGPNDLPQ